MNRFLKYLYSAAAGALVFAAASVLTIHADEPLTTDIVTTQPAITEATVTTITSENSSYTETTSLAVTSESAASDTQIETTLSSDSTTVSTTAVTTVTKVTVTCPPVNPETVTGWNNIDGKWFYFDGNKFLTGKQRIEEEVYIFANNGALRTGWQTVNTLRRFYDKDTHSPVYGWVDYRGNRYYNDLKTGKLTGMHQIDGNTYIFSDEGIMNTGFTMYENFMYYCDENGAVVYGDDKKTPVLINGEYYLISPKGYVLRGWQNINGRRYFYDYETGQPVFGWVNYRGSTYFVDRIIGKYTGKRYVDLYPYRFDKNGILQTGFQYFEAENKASYFYPDGTRAVSKIVQTNNVGYYFNEDGFMETGWHNVNEFSYYFKDDGRMAIGLYKIEDKMYIFDSFGRMCTGFQSLNGAKYLLGSDGVMLYGWHTIDGKKYYFSEKDGKALSGWFKDNGNKYYFGEDFSMSTGKIEIGDDTYLFSTNGIMQTGWQTIDNDTYYFSTDSKNEGAMYTYRHNIDGKDYLFYSTGAMVTDGQQDIVIKALSQLGQEGGRPYWTWWGFNFRIEWCACFVSWCATQCGYTQDNQTPKFISCKVGIDWFKEHKQWKGKNYTPKSGDYIFFDWEPDGIADHIGIVDYYEDGYVYTVEGNSNDEVRKRVYKINSENIYGFAAPNFTPSKGNKK